MVLTGFSVTKNKLDHPFIYLRTTYLLFAAWFKRKSFNAVKISLNCLLVFSLVVDLSAVSLVSYLFIGNMLFIFVGL